MTTKLNEKNVSTIANNNIQWQPVITADGSTNTNAVAGQGYFIDTTSATHTINLPSSPNVGDTVTIRDYAGTFATNNVTIGRNGSNIAGTAIDGTIFNNNSYVSLFYINSTQGWITTENEAKSSAILPGYVAATGGTVTTSGNFKIHSFTGDGCFVVSCAGNVAGSNSVSYLVVAGGGAGGQGKASNGGGSGGGAGGYREGKASTDCYSASPLVAPDGLPVSVTTYPITVGGGGGPGSGCGTSGSNSIFSTITSAGGGGGGGGQSPCNGLPGGSGAGRNNAGNTPPVSPPQGNNGGASSGGVGPGGGGAGGIGGTGPTYPCNYGQGGAGGVGVATSISGSPTSYAGGGGGGGYAGGPSGAPNTGGPGSPCGTGGRGNPVANGTANRGGGGGGNGGGDGDSNSPHGQGGKGVVIIRYKFQ